MARVERIGGATLYLGDCLDIGIPHDGAVVSDPPYGINHKVERTIKLGGKWDKQHTDRIQGDNVPSDPSKWIGKPAILWGANYYADRLPVSGGWLIFDKRRGGTQNQNFIASDCELAWSNAIGSTKIFSHLWSGLCRDSEVGQHYHPMQKPIALMEWCLGFIKNEVIIDPYMGSGSTGCAAVRLGRRFIGIEIDEKYYNIACRRIEQAHRQRDLFVQLPPADDPTDARLADLFAEPEVGA